MIIKSLATDVVVILLKLKASEFQQDYNNIGSDNEHRILFLDITMQYTRQCL